MPHRKRCSALPRLPLGCGSLVHVWCGSHTAGALVGPPVTCPFHFHCLIGAFARGLQPSHSLTAGDPNLFQRSGQIFQVAIALLHAGSSTRLRHWIAVRCTAMNSDSVDASVESNRCTHFDRREVAPSRQESLPCPLRPDGSPEALKRLTTFPPPTARLYCPADSPFHVLSPVLFPARSPSLKLPRREGSSPHPPFLSGPRETGPADPRQPRRFRPSGTCP